MVSACKKKWALCLLFLLFLSNAAYAAKPPALTPRDTKIKLEEIFKSHVCYHTLTPVIAKRALVNFLEELDPIKTYFLSSEIEAWLNPTDALLGKIVQDYKNEEFTTFFEIQALMLRAIERRHKLELITQNLPSNVRASEFRDLPWASSEEELGNRLLRMRSLQLEAAKKLDQETQEQFLCRLDKRRLRREEELTPKSLEEQKQIVLSFVLKAISSSLDSQTAYFTPAEANQFMIQVQQRLFGIGAQLRDDLNGFSIVRIVEGGPASLQEGLKVGDRIIAVNGEPVVGLDIVEAVEKIRGQQGSKAQLTILRPTPDGQEEKLEVGIIRGEVVLKETRLETSFEPYGDGIIAIVHLFSFYQDQNSSSAKDIKTAIETLSKQHSIKGVILDLRNNAGGLLPQAVSVTGLFIAKGIVVSIKDNSGEVQHLRHLEEKPFWDGPLLVLTNRASASAAEIVAQTLQDYGRALVVGDPETYGKGTFQTFTLESSHFGKVNPKGEYKVTRGRYYTVSGKSPQLRGVIADIVVPGLFSQMDIGEKYAKYPLESDTIEPNFLDTLKDIPPTHRAQVIPFYQFNLQQITTEYTDHLPLLRSHAQTRIENNKNYQTFLRLIQKDAESAPSETCGNNDLQLAETINIMKDLILVQVSKKAA